MAFPSTSKTHAARYESIVIGSGAAGGMAASVLTKGGAKVLMLEAGHNYGRDRRSRPHRARVPARE
ncbi:MAG TPA: NAD(P)/FAD-dependent oxidoreductase [Chthoniobacteraceae bacterium]|jgi:choline dehydrogenase-like flavoprotein